MNVLRNYWFLGGLLVANLLQAAVIVVPLMNEIFHTTPIPWAEAILIGAVASLVLWVEEVSKVVHAAAPQNKIDGVVAGAHGVIDGNRGPQCDHGA